MRDSKSSAGGGGQESAKVNEAEGKNEEPKAEQGVQILKDRGYSHEMIVQHLMFKVMDELERKHLEGIARTGNIKGFLE